MMESVFVIGRDNLPSRIELGEGESLRMTLVVLPGTNCDCRLDIIMGGCGAQLDLAGLYLCDGGDKVDIKVNLRHECGACTSRQLFRGIAGGESKAKFDGLIYVAGGADGTKAFQESHTLLLSDRAMVEARPQLEIYADDVECSHGATSGYLNPDEQFYMRSRGISEKDARRLQMISFLSSVAERLDDELKQRIYDSVH